MAHTKDSSTGAARELYEGFTYGAAPKTMRLSDEGRIAIGEELYRRMSRNDALREASMNSAAGIIGLPHF